MLTVVGGALVDAVAELCSLALPSESGVLDVVALVTVSTLPPPVTVGAGAVE